MKANSWLRLPLMVLGILAASGFATPAAALKQVLHARYVENPDGARLLVFRGWTTRRWADANERLREERFLQATPASGGIPTTTVIDLYGPEEATVERELAVRGITRPGEWKLQSAGDAADEVLTLLAGGPGAERIDLVFLGDGYTQEERGKFFADIQRLVGEMLQQQTFRSFVPFFNVHAVFRASAESGIGRNWTPKNTAYRLFRVGDTLRTVYVGDYAAARLSCLAAPDCDFPVIIANDPYYGGSGGEFAVSTSSRSNGTVVLRHELGHTIGLLGDEYDGSAASYYGSNWAASPAAINWSSWLTDAGRQPVAEPASALVTAYPWQNLAGNPYTIAFSSPGGNASRFLRFSASGLGDPRDRLDLSLDGSPIQVTLPADDDRFFYDIPFTGGFAFGPHELRFSEGWSDGNNMLCNVTLHEYGASFHADPGYVGAFPLFSAPGKVAGYRPTNETCLMRDMNHPNFCPVCQENLWLRVLERVPLISGLQLQPAGSGRVHVSLSLVPLGQLRAPGTGIADEKYVIRWLYRGREVVSLRDKLEWTGRAFWLVGRSGWEVEVKLITPEVRSDPSGLLTEKRAFDLKSGIR